MKGSATTNDLKKLADFIIGQSGGQFPVRGIVYEDILPANGIKLVEAEVLAIRARLDKVEVEQQGKLEKVPAP